jgi:hypothetical protein
MGWVVNATYRPLYPKERPGTHCTVHRLGGPQDRSGRVRKISPPTGGIRSADCPARSESLYRLRYPGPQRFHIKIYVNILFDDWGNAAHKMSRLTAQDSFTYICLKFENIIERNMSCHVCGVRILFDFSQFVTVRYQRKTNCRCFIKWNPAQLLRDYRDEWIRRITAKVLFNPGLASMLLKAACKRESWGEWNFACKLFQAHSSAVTPILAVSLDDKNRWFY